MDCYIIRVYRHFTGENGKSPEIAGLVEKVGNSDSSKPFSSYNSLVNTLREEVSAEADPMNGELTDKPGLKLVHTAKHG